MNYVNALGAINGLRVAATFGVAGNSDRIFASGSADKPNMIRFCAVHQPTYWPDLNYAAVGAGNAAVTGFTRVGNAQLCIHKQLVPGEPTLYFCTGALSEDGLGVFSFFSGGSDVEMVSWRTVAVLQGETLFLSGDGVHAMTQREQVAVQEYILPNRSFFVNGKLTQEDALKDAVAVVRGSHYYLAIGSHVYIADARYKQYDQYAGSVHYQYEWYYWEDVPASCLCVWEDRLVFGDNSGRLYAFIEGQFWDWDEEAADGMRPVAMSWQTPQLFMDTISLRKTIRHFVFIPNPYSVSSLKVGYVRDGEPVTLKEEQVDTLDFDEIDFDRWTFSGGEPTAAIISRRSVRKVNFIQLFFESVTAQPAGFYACEMQYVYAGKVS
jgi:hypothetical protein